MNKSTEQQSVWQRTREFLRHALRDNTEDFTTGPTGRALGLLAIPMMLEMAMESVFAVVDIAFVSRLGTDAVAAVGITEALITVLYGLAIGLGMGLTAMQPTTVSLPLKLLLFVLVDGWQVLIEGLLTGYLA